MRVHVGIYVVLAAVAVLTACSEGEKKTEIAGEQEKVLPQLSADRNAQRIIQVSEGRDSVSYVIGESDLRWCDISIPREDLRPGAELKSRNKAGDSFEVDCQWDGSYFVQSAKHNTWATFAVGDSVISADFRLVNPTTEQYLAFVVSGISTESQ